MIAEIPKDAKCQYEGCTEAATHIACGRGGYDYHGCAYPMRHPGIGVYCQGHASKVSHEGNPEYTETCPNCGCRFGVN